MPTESTRRQPLLSPPNPRNRRKSKVGEAAGDCAAVWCCFPCAALHLVILAVYRLPVGLWRKKKRNRLLRKKRKHGLNENCEKVTESDDDEDFEGESVNDFVEWEKEMMDGFYGTGFWRSVSQRTVENELSNASS